MYIAERSNNFIRLFNFVEIEFKFESVKGHLNLGLFNPKLQPQTFQPWIFEPWTFHPHGSKNHGWKVQCCKVYGWKVLDWKVRGWSLGLKSPGLRCPSTFFIWSSAENSIRVFLFLMRKTNLEYIHSCKKLRGDNADYYAKKSYLWGNRKADLAALVITPSSRTSHTRAATSRLVCPMLFFCKHLILVVNK